MLSIRVEKLLHVKNNNYNQRNNLNTINYNSLTNPSLFESTTEKIRSDKKDVVYKPRIPMHSLN